MTGSEEVWTVVDSTELLWTAWKALDGSLELARSLPNVGNHARTSCGKHILLSRCFASPKLARVRKSKIFNNIDISIGESTISE